MKVFSSSASSYALCENGLSLFVTFSCTNLTVKLLWLLQKSSWVVFWFLLSDENEVFLLRSSKIFFTLSLRCTSKHIWNQKIIQYDFVILLLYTYDSIIVNEKVGKHFFEIIEDQGMTVRFWKSLQERES